MSVGQWLIVIFAGVAAGTGVAALSGFRSRRAAVQARRREQELRFAVEQHSASLELDGPDSMPEVPTALVTSCAGGDSVLFAGTGVSASAGQPTWREALLGVLLICQRERPESVWNRLMVQIDDEQYDLVADFLIENLGKATFYNYLREVLPNRRLQGTDDVLREIERMPFSGAITSLWDDLALELFGGRRPIVVGPGSAPSEYSDVLRGDRFFVANAYGSLADGSLLVTADDFYEYLTSHTAYARFLSSIFGTRTVLFVGTSVAGIEELMRGMAVRSGDGRAHYALVPWSTEAELRRERLLRRYNVELLLYPPDPEHSGVGAFLSELARQVTLRQRLQEGRRRQTGVPLTRLTLENIGPFEGLELDFAADWNVLLANNGCGKSTILRSIALVLCGDDDRAVREGGRLLSADADAGSIRIRFGDDSFETRLVRERAHVRVVPHNVTPVQTGEWLVLGFPAIRGVSARDSRPAVASPGRGPVVEDVLPLIASEVDSRLDDLTQWLLNRIYVETVESGGPLHGGANRSTVERFFRMISRLGGGIELAFAGIDEETSTVLVETSDGTVPMDSLSQGMNSVLTWSGSLISRIEEMERMGAMRDGHAGLILIDEIDAHLHPSWQRRIIDAAQAEFTGIQFVATTHSPLVVGTMADGKLWRLYRDEEQAVQSEEFPADFRGWRADQILSSPLFDTDVRDPDTERLLAEYGRLAVLDQPSAEEEGALRRVAAELNVRLPSPEQREEARQAGDLIRQAAVAQLGTMPDAERARVLHQVRIQVQEAIVGSRPDR